MSDNPYTNDYAVGDGVTVEERTSALAITSLVLSLTCCLSPLGLLLGIISLVTIGGSGGRVKGSGLAIAAIVIGIVCSALLGFVGFGAYQANVLGAQVGFGAADNVLGSLEQDDFDAVRGRFVAPLDQVSDEALVAYRAAYEDAYGNYQSTPSTIFESLPLYGQLGQTMQNYQTGGQNLIPIPTTFDGGVVLVVAYIDQSAAPTTGPSGAPDLVLRDFAVVMPDGSELLLSEVAEAVEAGEWTGVIESIDPDAMIDEAEGMVDDVMEGITDEAQPAESEEP
ncbi:MAG: hypothetical protein CMJ31_09055 [Phycisphaerae bacterium]|nr:hypothetical protein [Phycisphaerae bacterium]